MSTDTPISSVAATVADYGNAVTLSGEHAEIARRLAELPPEQRLPFMAPSEIRRYHGYEPAATNLAAILAAAPPWPEPGYDVFGLPVPETDRLFWEWANWSPPVPDPALVDCPHTTTTAPPPAETTPTPQKSITDVIAEAIAWSRQQQRRDLPAATVTIGGQTFSQKDLDERFLERRKWAHRQLDDAIRGRMYEGQFPMRTSQEEADEWEQERRNRIRDRKRHQG